MRVFFVLLSLLFFAIAQAQNCAPPLWAINQPETEGKCYWKGMGEGSTMDGAMVSAWAYAFSQLANSRTTHIDVETRRKLLAVNDSVYDSYMEKVNSIAELNGQKLFTVMETQDAPYHCDGKYRYWVLLCEPYLGCECKKEISTSNFGGVLRSAVLPGWGQAYKGRLQRGLFFSGSTLVLGIAAFAFSVNYETEDNEARKSVTMEDMEYHRSWRDNSYYLTIGLSAGAVGVWVWNIFDAGNLKNKATYR